MSSQTYRGADPDGLIALTQQLEMLADDLDRTAAGLRHAVGQLAVVPAIDRIAAVSVWVRDAAATARRVALQVLSDGRDWRSDHSWFENVAGVASAFGHGFVSGAGGMVRGLVATVETGVLNLNSASQAIWDAQNDDWTAVGKDLSEVAGRERDTGSAFVHSIVGLAELSPAMVALHAHQDGGWRAARDYGHALGLQTPALIITVATAGAGAEAEAAGFVATASKVANGASNAGFVDPRAAASVWHHADPEEAAIALSVPVDGDIEHRVGLDPRNGDFVVTKPDGRGDLKVSEKRWSRLSDDERDAMKQSGVIEGHGHLVGT